MTVASATGARWPISSSVRRAVLTVHVIASVGPLGDSAGFLAVAIRAATTADRELADTSYELLDMFSLVFGIPLSFIALATGLTLGFGSRWGVLRHRWTTAKLLLILSVILVGSFAIGPASAAMLDGRGGGELTLVLAAAWDVLVLSLATGLSIYKPRRCRPSHPRRRRAMNLLYRPRLPTDY